MTAAASGFFRQRVHFVGRTVADEITVGRKGLRRLAAVAYRKGMGCTVVESAGAGCPGTGSKLALIGELLQGRA